MPFATIALPRVALVTAAARRADARKPSAKRPNRVASSTDAFRRSNTSRGSRLVTSAFGFGKKPAPEPEEPEEETEVSQGNPFASVRGKMMQTLEDQPRLKLPSLGGFNPVTLSRDADADDADDDDEERETASGAKRGNPFVSLGGFGNVGRTIDETVDLEVRDEEGPEARVGSSGKPFGGFAGLAAFRGAPEKPGKKTRREATSSSEASGELRRTMGNWERTLKEGIGEDAVPTWTLRPEPVRGAKLRSFEVRDGDSRVVGRDRGPEIDVVANVGCVSGVHCRLEMEGNKLYVTDLGSTNGTYVDGQEIRKNSRYRVFNGATIRLGAENVNGEPYVSYAVQLEGAKEMDRNSEYGQVQAIVEAVGGPKVVVNFLFVNVAFQLGFYLLLQMQTN
jgi:hypothetical protein